MRFKNSKFIVNNLSLTLSLIILFSICISCNVTNPTNTALVFELKDIGSTEVWFTLKSELKPLPLNVIIRNGNKPLINILLTTNDTIIFLDKLKPMSNYSFTAETIIDVSYIKSKQVNCTTLDTITHDFTWETFYFGGVGTSVLEDIEIIDENNIWVVGDIQDAGYDKDSVWQDQHNVVKWNGNEWSLERIFGYGSCTQKYMYPPPLKGIYKDSQNVIWASWGNQIINASQEKIYCEFKTGGFDKLEGFGDDGMIVTNHTNEKSILNYFKYGRFSEIKLENNGFIMDLLPIVKDNGEKIILFPHSSFQTGKYQLLSINAQKDVSLYATLPNYTSSVWTRKGYPLFICGGSSVYSNKTGNWKEINCSSPYAVARISGDNLNNIFAIGWGNVIHYNGSTWKKIDELDGYYFSVAVKDNIVVIVGMQNYKAVIVVGRKN